MRAEERQHRILARARSDGRVDVSGIAADLAVAPETVRRDLKVLEQHGLVRRTHGGAYPVESAGFETNLANRATLRVPEKRRIAAAAVELLGDAETVFVDEGFGPQLVAEAFPPGRPLTVITASIPVATQLATKPETTVYLLGGRVRGRTLATVDHWATQMLAGFVIDLAYLGANGISRRYGLTTPDPAVANVKAQVVRASRRRVFAGVHTKFGVNSFCRFASVADFETIVTDTGLSAVEAQRYSVLGPQVIRA
jgi:DeoR family fructose operon transcriptional repressor